MFEFLFIFSMGINQSTVKEGEVTATNPKDRIFSILKRFVGESSTSELDGTPNGSSKSIFIQSSIRIPKKKIKIKNLFLNIDHILKLIAKFSVSCLFAKINFFCKKLDENVFCWW